MTLLKYLTFVLLFLASLQLSAQCNINVDAGPDMTLCLPGGTVTLDGAVSGDATSFSWSPTTGLSDPNILNPTASITSTTTYTLTASVFAPTDNLIFNGDFGLPDITWTSDYSLGSGGPFGILSNEGTFATAFGTGSTHTGFADCQDHTGGFSQSLVINGATVANENIWCNTVSITPNTDYIFSAWLTSVNTASPAILQFSINGNLLASPFNLPPTTCEWNEFNASWNSGSMTSAEICIVNQNTAPDGNDFAIDDIFFGEVCEESDDVTITVLNVEAVVDPPASLPCDPSLGTVSLDGSASTSGPDITYQWTTSNGNIVSGANSAIATIDTPGEYTLTVALDDGTNSCSDMQTVEVIIDGVLPDAVANAFDNLNCINNSITLDGSGSSTGPEFDYLWTTTDGNIISGASSLNPTVDQAGTYQLLVTNTDNGCTQTANITVVEDTTVPSAVANANASLNCINTSITLDGSGSSTGSEFEYLWTTTDGSIISGSNSLSPTVDQAGTYQLLVTNTDNGCTQTANTTVTEDLTPPIALANAPTDIDCQNTSVTLSGSGSSTGAEFDYLWTTTDGNIVSGSNSLNPIVNQAGTYELLVTNTNNGCTQTANTTVVDNSVFPLAFADVNGSIDCINTSLTLDGSGSSTGSEFEYLWTTTDGNIVSGATSLSPLVDQAGTYQLLVTNTDNGCTQTASINVDGTMTLPNAIANAPNQLDCNNSFVILDGSGSSTGAEFDYLWTTTDGNIISGSTALNPTIDEAGTYQLLVTNTDNNCTQSTSITITEDLSPPIAIADAPMDIDCQNTSVILDGSGSSTGAEFDYLWTTTDGNIVSGSNSLNPIVNQAGTYELLVINTDNGCTQTASTTVVDNSLFPLAFADVNGSIDCINTSLPLDGSGSSTGSEFEYLWSTTDGNIVSGANSLNPIIDQAGTYQLLVTNTDNGCTQTASINVDGDTVLPNAIANAPNQLDCDNSFVILDGSGSSEGTEFDYLWTTTDGNITADNSSLNPTIDQAGTYQLLVTNTDNGCTQTTSITITASMDVPTITTIAPQMLNCSSTSITLDASGSSTGANFLHQWSTNNGNILSGSTSLTPSVDAAGNYNLLITDINSGCTATTSLEVLADFTLPTAIIAPPSIITCTEASINLDASNSSVGNEFEYLWTSPDGNIINGANTLSPEVNAAGTYQLLISNINNTCTITESVEVLADQEAPIADAGDGFLLDCNTVSQFLSGDNSSQGNEFEYLWSTTDGNILNGINSLNPEINTAGTYTLLVTNTINGCTASDQVIITQDDNTPNAIATVQEELNCNNLSVQIDGTGSSMGNNISFEWTTSDGNFIANENTLSPSVDAPGVYQLIITDNDNGCQAITNVTVNQNIIQPSVDAGTADTLTCLVDQIQLNPNNSSSGNEFDYLWTSSDGNIIGDPSQAMPFVNAPGTYHLSITNNINACSAQDSLVVMQDTVLPIADTGAPMVINCTDTLLVIDGSASSMGNEFSYQWTSVNGNILGGASTLSPSINASGLYELLVSNNSNGCTQSASINITADTTLPTIEIATADILNCASTQISLQANTNTGNEFTYLWSTTNGNIVSGANTLNPQVDAAGTYSLEVINTQNNCVNTASIDVQQNISTPIAEAGQALVLSCDLTQITLDGNGSETGNNITYQWSSSNGNILTGHNTLTPQINAPGTYTLAVSNEENACTALDTVVVSQDINAPIAVIEAASDLTCIVSNITLDAQNSSTGNTIVYQWTTSDGNILSGHNTLSPQVNAPGTYLLSVVDTANNCETFSSITVQEDLSPPIVDIQTPLDLNCTRLSIDLDAQNSSQGNEFTYLWTSTDGNISAGATSLTPTIDQSGTYELVATNTNNGCTSSGTISVAQDTIAPSVLIATPDDITCIIQNISLDANSSSTGQAFSYEWTSMNGNIVSGANSLNPIIDQAGDYTLLISDSNNGCTDAASVHVFADTIAPIANIQAAENLSCSTLSLLLSAQGSSQGSHISYAWTSTDGNIIGGENSLSPEIDAPGIYQIIVTDNNNGCTASSELEVNQDTEEPLVSIADPALLNCLNTQLNLDGSGSSSGANFSINWTSADGNIIAGNNTLMPTINQIGTYVLSITNLENGCENNHQVVVQQDISSPIVDAGSDITLDCFDNQAQLMGTISNASTFSVNWTTDNGSISSGSNTLTPSISATGLYTLTATNLSNGCSAQDVVNVEQQLIESIEVSSQDLSCSNTTGSISFANVIGGTAPYLYSIDGGNSLHTSTDFTNLSPANYQLLVQDINGCEISQEVNILPNIDLVVSIENQVTLALGDQYLINAQLSPLDAEIASVSWSPAQALSCSDCLNPIAQPLQTTTYTVEVLTTDGCLAQANIQFLVDQQVDIYFPNAFSPNGDGSNDSFYPFADLNKIEEVKTFQIFDRWGDKVFENTNFQPNDALKGWDGSFKGQKMNPAVFVYFAEVVFIDGSTRLFKGDVTLVR